MTGELQQFNWEITNTIFPIVSIMLWFVISVATYITTTSVPKIKDNTLRWRIVAWNIVTDIISLFELKKGLSIYLFPIYISIFILLFLFSILLLCNVNPYFIKISLYVLAWLFWLTFLWLGKKVSEIIKLSIEIDWQILDEEKENLNNQ